MSISKPDLISFLELRKSIGIIAIGIPVFLIIGSSLLGCKVLQPSISDYYHTIMRDGLVGAICAIALFLFCYKGYDKMDYITTRLMSITALLIAFFPTPYDKIMGNASCEVPRIIEGELVGWIHFMSAIMFFLALAYMCIFLFTKTKDSTKFISINKLKRNKIYKICGYTIIGCLLIISLYFTFLRKLFSVLQQLNLVFWMESICLIAFGIAWLTKGKAFYK